MPSPRRNARAAPTITIAYTLARDERRIPCAIRLALSIIFGSLLRVSGLVLARDPHVQFAATLTKVVLHLRDIQNGMHLLLDMPKVRPCLVREGVAGGSLRKFLSPRAGLTEHTFIRLRPAACNGSRIAHWARVCLTTASSMP